MNARDRALLFGRFGGGTLNTCGWREYASLSRLGLVDIDEADGFADMLNNVFGMARQNGYRRVSITTRGRDSALRQAEARVEDDESRDAYMSRVKCATGIAWYLKSARYGALWINGEYDSCDAQDPERAHTERGPKRRQDHPLRVPRPIDD